MNCQDAKNLLYEVIDNEASPQDLQNVTTHLGQCQSCKAMYDQEQSLHSAMKSKCCKAVESDCACERLKNDICSKLDGCDRESIEKASGRTTPIGRYILSIAAVLVLFVSVGYIGLRVTKHNRVYGPIEKLHWSASDHPEAYTQANFASATTSMQQSFDYHAEEKVLNFNLVGSKVDTLDGIPMQHLLYKDAKSSVSVFVAPAELFKVPSDLENAKVVKNGLTYFDHNCRGCRVLYHQEGNAMIITATADHSIDLYEFIPGRFGI